MCSQPEYLDYAEEETDALNIKKNIQKSFEKEQNSAKEIMERFEALVETLDLKVSATERPYNEHKGGGVWSWAKRVLRMQGANAEKDKATPFVEDVMKAIQDHMDSIKRTQTDVNRLLESDSFKDIQALMEETHIPAQYIPYMTNPYEPDISYKNMTKSKIKSAKTRPVVSLLYCPQKSELVTNVVKRLDEMLRKHLITYDIDLDMKFQESLQEIPEGVSVIVICLHASRLGTDVSNAVKGIRTGPNVAVIVLHHKDIHALPSQRSNKILTAPEFQTIGAIIDMGFLSQKGFYPCDINQSATEALTKFIIKNSAA